MNRTHLANAIFALVLAACLSAGGFAQQLHDTLQVAVTHPELRNELLAMEVADQEIRDRLVALSSAKPFDAAAFGATLKSMDSIDAGHADVLKGILRRYGWPGNSMVGRDGEEAAFLFVQHDDKDTAFQSRCLGLVQKAYEAGEATGQDIALLTDRILVHRGQRQRYGSQAKIVAGKIVVDPIEDEANVDKRRAALGLPPMKEYLEAFRKFYHLEGK